MWNFRSFVCAGTAGLTMLCGIAAYAQNFPSKPVTMVVPFTAGGITDAVSRTLAVKIGNTLGVPVIVENRPGGGGQIAANVVRQQPADGHTLFVGATEMFAINPTLYRKFSYDPLNDFAPISSLITSPLVLVVSAKSPVSTVEQLVSEAKSKKNGLNFASQGVGSIGHLLGEMFRQKTGGAYSHVAYKGSAPALQDVMAQQVDFMFDPVITTAPLITGQKLKPLAIAADQRSPLLPDVPTLAELGIANMNAGVWFGVVTKAGAPEAVVQKLNSAFDGAMRDPEVQQRFAEQGMQPFPSTSGQFGSFLQAELTRWTPLVQSSGAAVD